MLSCRAATALMEKRHREKISWGERLQLSAHTAMCAACRQYQKHSALMERLLNSSNRVVDDKVLEEQAAKLERKILRKLEERP